MKNFPGSHILLLPSLLLVVRCFWLSVMDIGRLSSISISCYGHCSFFLVPPFWTPLYRSSSVTHDLLPTWTPFIWYRRREEERYFRNPTVKTWGWYTVLLPGERFKTSTFTEGVECMVRRSEVGMYQTEYKLMKSWKRSLNCKRKHFINTDKIN